MTKNIEKEEISVFVDIACTKTVAAEQWFVNYQSNLTENTIKNKIFPKRYDTLKSGAGKQVSAIKIVILPARIAGKACKIEAKIVEENIPLLLSISSLKRCGTITDMNYDKATKSKRN